MNRSLPALLSFVAIACSPAGAAAPATVNPLTGQPLAFENAQRRLEQMRLETQLLEEEAKQAAIRNNLSLAPIRRNQEERRLQSEMFGPGASAASPPAAARPQAAAPRTPARPASPIQPAATPPGNGGAVPLTSMATAPVVPGPQPPQVLAIVRNGEQRRAIVQAGGSATTVAEGDDWMGRRIGLITERTVMIDGNAVELPRNPAVIAAIDRRPPPGQPQAGAVAGTMPRPAGPPVQAPFGQASPGPFAPLPPLPSLPPIGPVDPRNPLSVLGPQPGLPGSGLPGGGVARAGVPGAPVAAGMPGIPVAPSSSGGLEPRP